MTYDAYLHLSTGETLPGKRFGARGERLGELFAATGMTDGLATLTDPRCHGKLIAQTFPLAGNYGVIRADFESQRVHAGAYIVREWCAAPSNFRCEGSLDALLAEQGVPGLSGVDTRLLSRVLREHGAVNALLCDAPELSDAERSALIAYKPKSATAAVSCKAAYLVPAENVKFRAAVLDLGVNRALLDALAALGVALRVFPHDTPVSDILSQGFDGALISGGPGDPSGNPAVTTVSALAAAKLPLFAVGLGHQLLALSQGAKTYRLPRAHSGGSVRDTLTSRVHITRQSHAFAVDNALPRGLSTRFVNIHDGSCEGIAYSRLPALSLQFAPEHEGSVFLGEFLGTLGGR